MEPLDSTKPQVAEFIARQKKYLPRTSPTTYSLHGYNVAYLVTEVLRRIDGDITSEKIVAELEKVRDMNTGLMGPLTFTADRHAGSDSAAFMRAKDGKWSIVTDWIKAE
jgi:ABC-type branched-subunit amino acid transport system substrate-binding protein